MPVQKFYPADIVEHNGRQWTINYTTPEGEAILTPVSLEYTSDGDPIPESGNNSRAPLTELTFISSPLEQYRALPSDDALRQLLAENMARYAEFASATPAKRRSKARPKKEEPSLEI